MGTFSTLTNGIIGLRIRVSKIKVLLIMAGLLFLVQNASAAQMSGFAASYYLDDGTTPEEPTKLPLYPTISIGKKNIQMEMSLLSDTTNAPVEKDSSAHWICLHDDDGTNYWFISDNEMGAGLLTALAIAKDGNHKECVNTTERVSVSVSGVPLLNATHGDLVELFGKKAIGNRKKILLYQETPVQDGFVQSNTVSYYFDGEKLRGVIIGQITSN